MTGILKCERTIDSFRADFSIWEYKSVSETVTVILF